MPKTLLVIGAGREAIPGLQHAREMGLYLVATDANPHAAGFAYTDEQLIISTYDVNGTVSAACLYARDNRVDGVIALAADVPLTVATVAQALELPGISLGTARRCSNKLTQIRFLAAAGIPVPWYSEVRSAEHLKVLAQGVPWRLVVKPADSRGARGVIRLSEPDAYRHGPTGIDPVWAYEHARSQSPTGRVVCEEWLSGPQISTETVLHGGWAETPGFIDRNYARLQEYAPYVIEDGGEQPSRLTSTEQVAVRAVAERAARALGIANATAKGDIVLTKDGPVVIEMAARPSGGLMSSVQVPLATDVDLIRIALRLALGQPVFREETLPSIQRGVAIRYLWPQPGRVTAIRNVDAVCALRTVAHVDIPLKIGDAVRIVTDHTRRAGCVIAVGETRQDAVASAEAAVGMIDIETEKVS